MNHELAIRVEGLSKKYTFQNPISENIMDDTHEIWALKDVSFELNKGESLGIIGPNGSGKSTLLKILSRITKPTFGRVEMYGRVAAILDIGTGFHPDLSGRENIYLSGMLLGMSRDEISSCYDKIVEFSGIERFIEVPVKYYSSGMFIRLAFSIIAFLEADILIFDEVISVGDAAFTIKCKNKLEELFRKGRTLIIASHNMNDLVNYCSNTIIMEKGKVISQGDTGSEVLHYLEDVYNKYQASKQNSIENKSLLHPSVKIWTDMETAPGNQGFKVSRVALLTDRENDEAVFLANEDIHVVLDYHILEPHESEMLNIAVRTIEGNPVFASNSGYEVTNDREVGSYTARCVIPKNLLNEGFFELTFNRIGKEKYYKIPLEVNFKISIADNAMDDKLRNFFGPVKPILTWQCDRISEVQSL